MENADGVTFLAEGLAQQCHHPVVSSSSPFSTNLSGEKGSPVAARGRSSLLHRLHTQPLQRAVGAQGGGEGRDRQWSVSPYHLLLDWSGHGGGGGGLHEVALSEGQALGERGVRGRGGGEAVEGQTAGHGKALLLQARQRTAQAHESMRKGQSADGRSHNWKATGMEVGRHGITQTRPKGDWSIGFCMRFMTD